MLSKSEVRRIAGLELNAFNFARILPNAFEGGSIMSSGTPVYDINGTILYYRFSVTTEQGYAGYADVAASEAIGEPLLATSVGLEWNEKEVLNEAAAAAKQNYRAVDFDDIRVVAYSYPKIAAQFLKGGNEVLMLEWKSWVEIPGSVQHERTLLTPSNFERWSLLDEMPEETKQANVMNFKRRMDGWKTTRLSEFDFTTIKRKSFELPGVVIDLIDTHEVSYGACSSDHKPCFELRGQQTHVWCVAASVEMLLNFYRYQYSQARLARELGLGTCTSPNVGRCQGC